MFISILKELWGRRKYIPRQNICNVLRKIIFLFTLRFSTVALVGYVSDLCRAKWSRHLNRSTQEHCQQWKHQKNASSIGRNINDQVITEAAPSLLLFLQGVFIWWWILGGYGHEVFSWLLTRKRRYLLPGKHFLRSHKAFFSTRLVLLLDLLGFLPFSGFPVCITLFYN